MGIQILCENICRARKESAMSQKQLADIMGISVATLKKLENGEVPPRMKVTAILRFCKQFGLKPNQAFLPLTDCVFSVKQITCSLKRP